MAESARCLFPPGFMPNGPVWGWASWGVWWNVIPDAVIAITYGIIACTLFRLAHRRKGIPLDWLVVMFGVVTLACGCTHAMAVSNTWHGLFRLTWAIKAVTALASLVTMFVLLRLAPKLSAVPSLDRTLAMDAELSSEKQSKRSVEGQLKVTEDRFRILVEGIQDYAIFLMNPEGVVNSWNPGAERLTGYSAGDIIGLPFSRLFPQEEVASGRPGEILAWAAALGRLEDEGLRVRKDGSRFLVSGVITCVYDGEGVLQGFTKVCRDITAQRAAENALQSRADSLEGQVQTQIQELRASEARLQGFIRHAPAVIAFKDAEGRFLVINPQMEAIIGKPSAEILGRRNEDLFPPEVCAHYRERDERALRLRQAIQEENRWVDAEGELHYVLSHVFPLVDGTGQGWGLGYIGTDITERKQADQALLQSQKLESLGVMAGGIAHDFNNLLGAMLGNVELARAEPEQTRHHLETLEGLIDKASGLLRQMLAYSGEGRTDVQTLDLNRLVVEMTDLLGTSISRRATLHLDLHPQPLLLVADPSQVRQVVMNLVINASEALEDHPGAITLSTWLEDLGQDTIDLHYEGQILGPGPHVALQVADTGAGMAPEVLRRIFEPFFSTKFTGRGLGLAAVHGILRSHSGGFRVSSAAGKGSTFRLLFPAARDAVVPSGPEPAQGRPDLPARGSGLVVVVDDEDAMRSVAVRGLERAGFQTLQARDGREALALFEANRGRIQVILLDLTMPTLDGEAVYQELRRQGAAVPVILCSGFDESEALRRFEGVGLAGFLQKPFRLGPLVAMVQQALAG